MIKRLVRIGTWLVVLGLLWNVLRSVSLAETWQVLQQLQGLEIVIIIGLNILVLLLMNGRWWLLLYGKGYPLSYCVVLGHRLATFAVSYFTPGPQFGGEAIQVLLLERRHAVPRTTAVTTVTLDKLLELLVNFAFLFVGAGIVAQTGLLGDVQNTQAFTFAIILLSLPLLLLIMIALGWQPLSRLLQSGLYLPWWATARTRYQRVIARMWESEAEMSRFCWQAPRVILLAFLVSIVSWVALIGEFWYMVRALGLSLTLSDTLILLTMARIAFLLPAPGGLGTLETAQVTAFTLLGLNPVVGIGLSLLIHLRDVLVGFMGLTWLAKWLPNYHKSTRVHNVNIKASVNDVPSTKE